MVQQSFEQIYKDLINTNKKKYGLAADESNMTKEKQMKSKSVQQKIAQEVVNVKELYLKWLMDLYDIEIKPQTEVSVK